jgi:hypothetical protein
MYNDIMELLETTFLLFLDSHKALRSNCLDFFAHRRGHLRDWPLRAGNQPPPLHRALLVRSCPLTFSSYLLHFASIDPDNGQILEEESNHLVTQWLRCLNL